MLSQQATTRSLDKSVANNGYKLMLFDLKVGGHHATYIRHLVEYWIQKSVPGRLEIIVSPEFIQTHRDVVDLAVIDDKNYITFCSITEDEFSSLKKQKMFLASIFREWAIYCQYARQTAATQSLLMYFDHLQIPLVFGEKSPCRVAGIYFRPTFHYSEFVNHSFTIKDTIRQWRKKSLLKMSLKKTQLNALFCLDPFAVKQINHLSQQTKNYYLPDPIQPHPVDSFRSEVLKTNLGIERSRKILLLFGSVDSRKGIYPLLEALQALPPHLSEKLCLLLVGRIASGEKSKVMALTSEIASSSLAQVIVHDEFVTEAEVPVYFHLTDVVLATYQRHVGMSGILLQAAAAGKPIIASNYGLMGELVRRYELGLAVDSEQPSAIVQALSHSLQFPSETWCNLEKMEQLVNQNLTHKFVETIISKLVPSLMVLSP